MSLEEVEQILIFFSTSLFAQDSEEAILWDLAHNCIAHLGFVDCVVYLVDEKRQVLVQKAALGPKNPQKQEILNPIDIPMGQGVTGHVAQTGKAEVVADTSADARYIVDDESRLSEIAVPILLDGKVIGVIDSEHPQKDYFTGQHLRILTAVASVSAIKIQNIRTEEQRRREQKQLAELKAHALKAHLSPHFVFNALNAIQYFITADDKALAIRYLSIFSKLIRYHLNHYEADTVVLKGELDMLEAYLKLQQLRYAGQFDYQISHTLSDSDLQVRIPALILSSLMENAIEQSMIRSSADLTAKNRLYVSLDLGQTLTLKLAYPIHNGHQKQAEYRKDLLPWEEQVHRLNRLKDYCITTETVISPGADRQGQTVNIIIHLPLLPV